MADHTEHILVIEKDGELVDILSNQFATVVLMEAAKRYPKSEGYEYPSFPDVQAPEG
jgi:hypothetical protein